VTRQLVKALPAPLRQCLWHRTFCTRDDGFNINTFYRNFVHLQEKPSVLLLQDTAGGVCAHVPLPALMMQTFGAFTSCGWKKSDGFYGSGESFLFKVTVCAVV
jgi:hypothetical protein